MPTAVDSVFQAFEKLVIEFSFRRFVHVALLVIVAGTSLVLVERHTHFFAWQKMKKESEILLQLQQVENAGGCKNEALKKAHELLSQQLTDSLVESPLQLTMSKSTKDRVSFALLKWATATAPWLFLALLASFAASKTGGRFQAFAMASFIGCLIGALGMTIPTFYWPWFNLVIYPVGHFFVILGLVMLVGIRAALKDRRKGST